MCKRVTALIHKNIDSICMRACVLACVCVCVREGERVNDLNVVTRMYINLFATLAVITANKNVSEKPSVILTRHLSYSDTLHDVSESIYQCRKFHVKNDNVT